MSKDKKEKSRVITREDCLIRLFECLNKADFTHKLTRQEREQMENNFQIIAGFTRLMECEEYVREVRAIGFRVEDEEEEEYYEEEEEDEDENAEE